MVGPWPQPRGVEATNPESVAKTARSLCPQLLSVPHKWWKTINRHQNEQQLPIPQEQTPFMTRSGSRSSEVHQARQAVQGLLKQGITVPSCFTLPFEPRTPARAFLRTHSWSRQGT